MKRIFALTLFTLFLSVSFTQEFSASVSSTKVEQYERFQVDFTFNSNDMNGIEGFRPPSFSQFKVLTGPNQSTSMQIINGAVSSSVTYSYILTADNIGQYTIGQASINFKGKSYSSKPIVINIIQGDPNRKKNQQTKDEISTADLAKDVFILATPDKKRAYVGEQITVTYKLFTRTNIASPQISKLPQYNGFWSEELMLGNNITFNFEMHNGERFRSATIKKVALFATKTGNLEVTPFELVVPVQVRKKKRTNDVFEDFFNDSFFNVQTVDFKARSNTIKMDIMPLPSSGVPASFNGIVGDYKINSQINKTSTKVNDPVSVKITISGQGNIKLLSLPELNLPSGLEKYEPKTTEQLNNSAVISGTKTIEYIIVPRLQGKKTIPSIEFSYFNINKKKYETFRSPEYIIDVAKGSGEYESTAQGVSKEDVELLSQDIRFIKTSDYNFEKTGEFSLIKTWFWIFLLLPVISFVGLVFYKKRELELAGNTQLLKFKKAEKTARQKLKTAKDALATGDKTLYFNALDTALTNYLQDKFGINKYEFTVERIISELAILSADESNIETLKHIFEKCELARFAPGDYSQAANEKLLEDAIQLVISIENLVKVKK